MDTLYRKKIVERGAEALAKTCPQKLSREMLLEIVEAYLRDNPPPPEKSAVVPFLRNSRKRKT